jgi:MarR family transcriptional regulator, organic hydroperoxide resistance regulator
MFSAGINRVLQSYPKIYLACHTRHIRDNESGEKLTQHQASVLDHLSGDSPLSVSELARHLDVTESTMSIQVTQLENAGYVRRIRDSRDRRCVRVRLTAQGVRVKQQNTVLDPDLVRQMISLLGPDDAEAALRGLELLSIAAEKLMNKRPVRRTRRTR